MAKPVVFAVDDREVLRSVARDLRRHYARGYRILSADSGPSALDQIKPWGGAVALFLVDQGMHRMVGMESGPKGTRFLVRLPVGASEADGG